MGVTIRGGGPPSLDEVRERLMGRFEVVEDDLIKKRATLAPAVVGPN